jgi:hypothetical protein
MPTVLRIRSGYTPPAGSPYEGAGVLTAQQAAKLDTIAQSGAFAVAQQARARLAQIRRNISAQQAREQAQILAVARADTALASLINDEFTGVTITDYNDSILNDQAQVQAISVERA